VRSGQEYPVWNCFDKFFRFFVLLFVFVRELYLFNIDAKLTEADMRAYFDKFGKVDQFVKKERYGFLLFETGTAMSAMLAVGEFHVINELPPFGARISQATSSQNSDKYVPNQREETHFFFPVSFYSLNKKKVFLLNLPRGANAANLKERFEQYGEIKDCRVMYNSASGLAKSGKGFFRKNKQNTNKEMLWFVFKDVVFLNSDICKCG
jgi:RNA recognition motif-containing protein